MAKTVFVADQVVIVCLFFLLSEVEILFSRASIRMVQFADGRPMLKVFALRTSSITCKEGPENAKITRAKQDLDWRNEADMRQGAN